MAVLHDEASQRRIYLRPFHVFGRSRGEVDTLLDSPDASRIHASIRWERGAWLLYDHSRNGSYINLNPLPAGGHRLLAGGDSIRFGARQSWTVQDLAPPRPVLLPENGALAALELSGVHLLPDDAMPEASVYQDADGRWICEDADGQRLLADGDYVQSGEHRWQYRNGVAPDATTPIGVETAGSAPPVQFNFAVSQNEEHVELSISTGRELVDLGERSHHYGLLTLARQRLRDARRGFDRYSQGWLGTDELARMLQIDAKHLNMQMHRARQQIGDALAASPAPFNFIERRRGELRFGNIVFQIRRGAQLEGVFDPVANC